MAIEISSRRGAGTLWQLRLNAGPGAESRPDQEPGAPAAAPGSVPAPQPAGRSGFTATITLEEPAPAGAPATRPVQNGDVAGLTGLLAETTKLLASLTKIVGDLLARAAEPPAGSPTRKPRPSRGRRAGAGKGDKAGKTRHGKLTRKSRHGKLSGRRSGSAAPAGDRTSAASDGGTAGGSGAGSAGRASATPEPGKNGEIRTVTRGGERIGASIAPAFDRMVAAARRDGVTLKVNSGFRSHAEQVRLWRQNPNPALVARPGTSNHEKGTAIDFSSIGRAWAWLKQNATRFGFRNYPVEAWHYDYVGK